MTLRPFLTRHCQAMPLAGFVVEHCRRWTTWSACTSTGGSGACGSARCLRRPRWGGGWRGWVGVVVDASQSSDWCGVVVRSQQGGGAGWAWQLSAISPGVQTSAVRTRRPATFRTRISWICWKSTCGSRSRCAPQSNTACTGPLLAPRACAVLAMQLAWLVILRRLGWQRRGAPHCTVRCKL